MKLRLIRSGEVRRRGLSMLELSLSSAILLLCAKVTLTSIDKLQRVASHTSSASRLQEEGERALARIVALLQRSGVDSVGGKDFPSLFLDGVPSSGFDLHGHDAPISFQITADGTVSSPPNREIVFLQPIDADAPGAVGHGVPDTDGNGDLAWDSVEHSLVVLPVSDDANELQYRRDGDSPETLAVGVESFVCSDSSTAGVNIHLNSIQVELTLRGRDEQGRIVRYTTRAVVRLRNG